VHAHKEVSNCNQEVTEKFQ